VVFEVLAEPAGTRMTDLLIGIGPQSGI